MRPSCGAKRAAELAAFLVDDVVEDVGHAQWVFTVPKILRVSRLTASTTAVTIGELQTRRWDP
jgi:hypothetical protein